VPMSIMAVRRRWVRGLRLWVWPGATDEQRHLESLPAIRRVRLRLVAIIVPTGLFCCLWVTFRGLPVLTAMGLNALLAYHLNKNDTEVRLTTLIAPVGLQVLLSVLVGITGGLASPFLSWLVIPVSIISLSFRRTVVLSVMALALSLATVACLVNWLTVAPVSYPQPVLAVSTTALGAALAVIFFALQTAELDSRRAARTDGLTGILNRAAFEEQVPVLLTQARDEGLWISMLACDLDHFKNVNDKHGHAMGDEVLRRTGEILRGCIRADDKVFRVGGEEFFVVLPRAEPAIALAVARRICETMAATRFGTLTVTCSVGVASTHASDASSNELVLAADQALYRAKSAGRNQVITSEPVSTSSQG
jgi:diguanylate cyclase (GGDEF)-like protein